MHDMSPASPGEQAVHLDAAARQAGVGRRRGEGRPGRKVGRCGAAMQTCPTLETASFVPRWPLPPTTTPPPTLRVLFLPDPHRSLVAAPGHGQGLGQGQQGALAGAVGHLRERQVGAVVARMRALEQARQQDQNTLVGGCEAQAGRMRAACCCAEKLRRAPPCGPQPQPGSL